MSHFTGKKIARLEHLLVKRALFTTELSVPRSYLSLVLWLLKSPCKQGLHCQSHSDKNRAGIDGQKWASVVMLTLIDAFLWAP